MSLRPGWQPPAVHFNVISGRGGLGDNIARLPAYKYMIETYEHISATIYVQDYVIGLVEYLLPPGPRMTYKKLSTAPWELAHPIIEFDQERIGSLHLHLTTQAFLMLMDQLPPSQESMAYIKAAPVALSWFPNGFFHEDQAWDKMVVLTSDYTAPARQWPAVHVNTLGKRLREAGLTPVLLGSTKTLTTGVPNDDIKARRDDGIRADLFVDLRDKTTLIEALGVMQRAKAVVGVDNGLLHLAHCTDTPVVMGYTTLKPEHRDPVRGAGLTKTLEAQVPCAGCQSRGFAINTDWRECVMTESRYACTLTLTADRYMKALTELGVIK